MGNYASCTSLVFPKRLQTRKATRVILPAGEIRHFQEPIKAAELMLESPSFFVVDSKSLIIGRRFAPLPADEDLEFGNLYAMFPMRRANSVVTAADVTVFLMSANSAPRRIQGGSGGRISPVGVDRKEEAEGCSGSGGTSRLNLDGVAPELKFRAASCRSRKPLLDTISEEPVISRSFSFLSLK